MTNGLQPYPEYKDSGVQWLGNIPANWKIEPVFGEFRPKNIKNTGLIENTVLSLSYGRIVIKPIEKLHGLVPASFETYQIVEPGDIIIRTTDLQNDHTSLRIGQSEHRGIITSAYMCLQVWNELLPKYGYHILNTWDLTKAIYGYGSGLRQNLSFEQIKRMPIPVPSPEEQAAIVRYLDQADTLIRRYIRAKRREIILLNEQKQAIIQEVVTKGLDPNVSMKDSGIAWIGEIPAHWEVWKIGYLAKVGNGSTPSRSTPSYWENGNYPWLNSSTVNQGRITSADQFVTPIALKECHLPIISANSVLVAITGQGKTRGTAALLMIEATINQHIAYISPQSKKLLSEYLKVFLDGHYSVLRSISESSGSTKGALTCYDLKQFKILLPPFEEQEAIIAAVNSETETIDKAIEYINHDIKLTREYHTRLVADVVTGKLDVRQTEFQLPEIFDNAKANEPDLDEVGPSEEDMLEEMQEEIFDAD